MLMKLLHSSLLALALAASSGCASSNRMMRFMPGGGDAMEPVKAKGAEDRVNAWPALNVENGKVAALWPMVDADARGFAVRPLFNKEDSEYSLLFPLCAWNPVNGDGWCVSAYWNKDCSGFFPFAHFKRDGLHYLMPVFWNPKEGDFGSPVCYFSNGLNFVGPVWWRGDKTSSGEGMRYGFLPLFKEGSSGGWLLPVYYRNVDKDGRLLLTPLGGAKVASDGSLAFLDVLGPVYASCREEGRRELHILAPVFRMGDDGFRVLPLVSKNDKAPSLLNLEKTGFSIIGTLLFKYDNRPKPFNRTALESQALALAGRSGEGGHTRSWRFLFISGDSEFSGDAGILPAYGKVHGREFALLPFLYGKREVYRSMDRSKGDGLRKIKECLWERKDPAAAKRRMAGLLKSQGVYYGDSDAELAKALAELDARPSHFIESESWGTPLLWKDSVKDGTGKGDVLWFLSRWNSEGGRSRFSILEYMYRQERDGEASRYDILPFISVDKAPGYSRHSFLWRVLSWRTDKDGVRVHALFVPFDL